MLFPEGSLPARNYAYLDDYVYIDGVQFTPLAKVNRSTTIIAYEKIIYRGDGRRYIAFSDGHTNLLGENRARSLFEEQGLKYPMDTWAEASK